MPTEQTIDLTPAATPEETLLDNTLRYLYTSLRKNICELMAIEFKYKGTVWRVDTPAEAVALRKELANSEPAAHDQMDRLSDLWTPDRFMDVMNAIGELQQAFLITIDDKPNITSTELVRKLGLDSDVALAGVISGLSKQLKGIGIEPKDVFLIDVKWTGKTKTRRFLLDDFFRNAGAEQNWPEAWKKKPKKRVT